MLAKDCLAEFKVECDLRRLSSRTTKGYYNNTALFLTYLEKLLEVTELEEIRTPHIKKYLQYTYFDKHPKVTTPKKSPQKHKTSPSCMFYFLWKKLVISSTTLRIFLLNSYKIALISHSTHV